MLIVLALLLQAAICRAGTTHLRNNANGARGAAAAASTFADGQAHAGHRLLPSTDISVCSTVGRWAGSRQLLRGMAEEGAYISTPGHLPWYAGAWQEALTAYIERLFQKQQMCGAQFAALPFYSNTSTTMPDVIKVRRHHNPHRRRMAVAGRCTLDRCLTGPGCAAAGGLLSLRLLHPYRPWIVCARRLPAPT